MNKLLVKLCYFILFLISFILFLKPELNQLYIQIISLILLITILIKKYNDK